MFLQEDDEDRTQNGHTQNGTERTNSNEPKLELSFEYLMNKDSLQWVTIHSERAMFMSVCLQVMYLCFSIIHMLCIWFFVFITRVDLI